MTDGNDATDESTGIDRRGVLKGMGVAGGAALVGGAGVTAFSGAAAAEASATFTVSSTSLATHDGTVQRVYITPSGGIDWANFDEEVDGVRVRFSAKVEGSTSYETVWDRTYDGLGGHGGYSGSFDNVSAGDVTLYSGDRADDLFGEPEDGTSRTRTVHVKLQVDLLNASGALADPNEHASVSDSDTFSATSTNREGEVSITASADSGMEGGSTTTE
ncbi:hypothetical protein ACFPYI_04520 [Halomarina salina]|uniref:Twin-arginine translocation signal domain-containing protein n=1 Tax=Halomarina salina TaxID=1872699 RepID=A0ABD5RJT4_9EURY|nr:hypothetical protein [Halomarina salina]